LAQETNLSEINSASYNVPNSNRNNNIKSNPFLEDLKKLEMTQKSNETYENRSNFIPNQVSNSIIENVYKSPSYINIVESNNNSNNLKSTNEEITNDEDFNKNYESIMSYFSKYKEANAKVIENLILLEDNNENSHALSKNKRKKNLQNLEEFYKNSLEPKATTIQTKDNSRYNLVNSKSFSDKVVMSEHSQLQTSNLKLIPFHLVEKKKLLINMMNYLYGKNIFHWKKSTTA
jgi:hypothetical protein